ncbi:MAG: MBL fold metallo-hydrolase [Bacteroidetes bacterium]|nr:MBL fold metallo-hydrolase [Bacteroidota bacterium]
MKVKFYGVRGSVPVCGPEFQLFGGNTTCICLTRENANRIAIIDAGTGIRNLGKELIARQYKQELIYISFTHFHWDHIQGFPFFAPAYDKNQKIGIHVMGSKRHFTNIHEIFSLMMRPEYFPVQLEEMGAQFEFPNLGDQGIFFGARVSSIPQQHLTYGGSYALRIEDVSGSIVLCTDIEHGDTIDERIVEFAKNADMLIHDGQYTDEEYKKLRGWGHSTWKQAVEVAQKANVKKLVITHHDPDHDDNFLIAMEKECKREFPNSVFAREGMEIAI